MAISIPTTLEPWNPTAEWGSTEQRQYSIGTDRGMLYLDGIGVPWTGLVSVNRKTSSGESEKRYIDGRIFRVQIPPGDFEAVVEAYTYPYEFEACIGSESLGAPGLLAHGQSSTSFGMSYRTLSGDGDGYSEHSKIHLIYEAVAEMSDYRNDTVNDSPQLAPFSFDIFGIPISGDGFRPTTYFSVDSRNVDEILFRGLEHVLYGHGGTTPRLPSIEEIREYLYG